MSSAATVREGKPLTRGKLEEAQFFLKHVEAAKGQVPQFDHYLNAFVGAARSITFVMQAEYDRATGFREWYDSKGLGSDGLLSAMNTARVRSVHKEPLRTDLLAVVDIPASEGAPGLHAALLPTDTPGAVEIVPLDGSDRTAAILKARPPVAFCKVRSTFRHINEFSGEDVLLICKKYFQRLTRLRLRPTRHVAPCRGWGGKHKSGLRLERATAVH